MLSSFSTAFSAAAPAFGARGRGRKTPKAAPSPQMRLFDTAEVPASHPGVRRVAREQEYLGSIDRPGDLAKHKALTIAWVNQAMEAGDLVKARRLLHGAVLGNPGDEALRVRYEFVKRLAESTVPLKKVP